MDDNKALNLDKGKKIHFLNKDPENFLRKSTLIFGATSTGKTTLCEEILYLCKDIIPTIFVICPTNSSSNAYTGKVPSRCIKDDLDMVWLEKLLARQKHLSEVCKLTESIDILLPIFKKVADPKTIMITQSIYQRGEDSLSIVDQSENLNYAKKKTQRITIQQDRCNILKKIYKSTIKLHKKKLLESIDLEDFQRTVVEMIDVYPDIMLIFDDCASKFKKWYKERPDLFKALFFEGRWKNISLIILSQDDKEIDSEIRKNARVTIFTTQQAASATFERGANHFSKFEKDLSREIIKKVFYQPPNEPKHYQKLCYLQNELDPFRYTIADLYEDFKFGCPQIWELNKKIGDNNSINKENPFFIKYG